MATKTIYLLKYNNYFNREIKGHDLTYLDPYLENGAKLVSSIKNMTLWNPNDGVDTLITSKIDMYSIPDYCLVCDSDSDIVISRWFVIEATRIQGGQYRLKLHRDLIADNYDEIMNNEDNYIERGWCDVSNDAIYNSEPFTFNEIKNKQIKLFDRSGCPWIVMYFTSNKYTEDKESAFPEELVEFIDPTDSSKSISVHMKYALPGSVPSKPSDSLTSLDDAPYAMLVMPYDTRDYYNGDTKIGTITKKQTMAIAKALSAKYSAAGWMLDMQLLPYCPFISAVRDDGNIDLNKVVTYAQTQIKGTSGTATLLGGPFCCRVSSFDTILYDSNGNEASITVNDIKVENLTAKMRIVSPNGNGMFEFNPAKLVYSNGSSIKFDAYCTYMPYQPYIKVTPRFTRLYGADYQDYRGLICGGNFSLPQISDAWNSYELTNKNYQAMFNRQIQSMEVQNKAGRLQDITGAVSGTVSAGFQGALTGSMFAPGIGTVVGAGIGAGLSAIGGVTDIVTNNKLRADQKNASIDQHNMQLQNIQALPYNITNLNNFNQDNALVPYIEDFVANDYEVDNFIKYLNLKSYTINRYGKLKDYTKTTGTTWLQGTIIKLNISDDAHYIAAIFDEVKQGFYIKVEG